MRFSSLLAPAFCIVLCGCVYGSGPCLLQEPFKHSFQGKVRIQTFATGDGIDYVPILTLDRTAYIYAPANSRFCVPANEVQLVGWSQLPPDIVDDTHVEVTGSLFQAATMHQHTPFLVNVRTMLPLHDKPGAAPANPPPNPPPSTPH
jgi:hypothetical protein